AFADIEGAFSTARFAPMTLIGGRLNQISVLPAKIGFRSPRATRTSRIGARSFAASAHVGSWHNSEGTNEASDFRLGGQSGLSASVARTAALDPYRSLARPEFCTAARP